MGLAIFAIPKLIAGQSPAVASETCDLKKLIAGWSSLVARRAHNPKVVGSNPTPATKFLSQLNSWLFLLHTINVRLQTDSPTKIIYISTK